MGVQGRGGPQPQTQIVKNMLMLRDSGFLREINYANGGEENGGREKRKAGSSSY